MAKVKTSRSKMEIVKLPRGSKLNPFAYSSPSQTNSPMLNIGIIFILFAAIVLAFYIGKTLGFNSY